MANNRVWLADGTNFIKDCDKGENPVQGRIEKMTFLLTLNLEAMGSDNRLWTAEAVRALATCLVPTTDGKKRLTKSQLIENLKRVQTAEREARAVKYAEMFERHSDSPDFARDVNRFMSMMTDLTIDIDTLAGEALKILKTRYKTDNSLIKTGIIEFKRMVRLHEKVSQIDEKRVDNVLTRISKIVEKKNQEISYQYNQKVIERADGNLIPVNPSYLYYHAINTLTNLETATWKEVSIALAFSTGRRMSEVHGINTRFEVTGEYSVMFTGQLKKTKSKNGQVTEYIVEPPYEIPTIVPAELVVKGFEFITAQNKLYTPRKVNETLSKPLSTDLPKKLSDLLKDKAKIRTYKDMRAVYALVMFKTRPTDDDRVANVFYASILGHNKLFSNVTLTYQTFKTDETFDPVTHAPLNQEPDYQAEWDAFDKLSP